MLSFFVDNSNGRGETYGSESKCFDHGSRWTANAQSVTPYDAGCYEVCYIELILL